MPKVHCAARSSQCDRAIDALMLRIPFEWSGQQYRVSAMRPLLPPLRENESELRFEDIQVVFTLMPHEQGA